MADDIQTPENDDELDADLGEDTTTDEGGEGQEWTPPTREDWNNVQEALRKARRDARAAKRRTGSAPKDGEAAPDVDEVRTAAEQAAAAKFRPMVIRSAARSAFAEAGLVVPEGKADAALGRALRLLDLDDLEITDDGDVEGLAEQIEEIKADFPELFAGAQRPRRAARVDGGASSSGDPVKRTSADKIASMLLR